MRPAFILSIYSFSDGVNVIIVGRVNLSIVTEGHQSLIKRLCADSLLDHIPDVTLVNELVRL